MPARDPVFAQYHRAEDRHVAVTVAGWGVPIAAVVAGLVMWAIRGSAGASAAVALPADDPIAVVTSAPSPDAAPTDPAPAAPADPAPAATPAATPPPAASGPNAAAPAPARAGAFTIAITATGYQAELDECQWVRMDLGASAPIVGARTSCGGAIVLRMQPGDVVRLDGQGLDGSYRVVDSRGAHAGDPAAAATSGMGADVILQTCYPGTGGRERLVGLVRR